MNRPSFRKSIALLLQAVMLAGLFAACGKTGEKAEDPLPSAPEKVEVIVPSATVFAPQQDPEISLRITEVMFSNKTVIQDHAEQAIPAARQIACDAEGDLQIGVDEQKREDGKDKQQRQKQSG